MKHSFSPSLIILLVLVCIAAWSMSYSGGSGGSRSSKSSSSSRGSGDSGAVSVVASEFMERPLGRAGDLLIEHTGYALVYNTETNCPDWVAWELTQEEADGKDARRVNDFRGDPLVPEACRVETADYKDCGYDRGHMCPAGDMKWSSKAMSECFYMSNICPQSPTLNRQWWEHLESACRRWARQEGSVYICCGPIFKQERKKKYLGNTVRVRVPNSFFKVVLSLKEGEEKAIGFVYSNRDSRQPMEEAVVTVDSVERLTGLDFYYQLNSEMQEALESKANLTLWR